MQPTFKVTGMEKMDAVIEKVRNSVGKDNVNDVALKQAEVIRDKIEENAPAGKTQNLKRSPVAKKLDNVVIAAIDRKIAPHAHLVEFGTSRAPAHPFFRPAIDSCREKVADGLKDGIKDLIEKATK